MINKKFYIILYFFSVLISIITFLSMTRLMGLSLKNFAFVAGMTLISGYIFFGAGIAVYIIKKKYFKKTYY